MTNETSARRTPPGWYPDPAGTPQSRWWDGDQWTDHLHDPSIQPYTATAQKLSAPEGTKPYTPLIWVLALMPLVEMLLYSTFDWNSYLQRAMSASLQNPTSATGSLSFVTPQYLLLVGAGWGLYGLAALLAFFDWRALKRRGVPSPFHFAWVFLSYGVYVIGRSVIVRRRTGRGIAPMWVWIGLEIANVILITAIVIVQTISLVSQISGSFSG